MVLISYFHLSLHSGLCIAICWVLLVEYPWITYIESSGSYFIQNSIEMQKHCIGALHRKSSYYMMKLVDEHSFFFLFDK